MVVALAGGPGAVVPGGVGNALLAAAGRLVVAGLQNINGTHVSNAASYIYDRLPSSSNATSTCRRYMLVGDNYICAENGSPHGAGPLPSNYTGGGGGSGYIPYGGFGRYSGGVDYVRQARRSRAVRRYRRYVSRFGSRRMKRSGMRLRYAYRRRFK